MKKAGLVVWNHIKFQLEIPYNETQLRKKKNSEPFGPGDKAELKTPMETNSAAAEFQRTTKLITRSKLQIKETSNYFKKLIGSTFTDDIFVAKSFIHIFYFIFQIFE